MEQFNLNKEIGYIPEKSEDQLGYAFKIIENAYESKVSEMIIEIRQLNESLNEKIVTIGELEKKTISLEKENLDLKMQSNQLLDDNKNLVSFVNELKSENQQLSQLKNSIMTSIKSTSPVPSGNAKNIQNTEGIMRNYGEKLPRSLENFDYFANQKSEILSEAFNKINKLKEVPSINSQYKNESAIQIPSYELKKPLSTRPDTLGLSDIEGYGMRKDRSDLGSSRDFLKQPASILGLQSRGLSREGRLYKNTIFSHEKEGTGVDGKEFFKTVKEKLSSHEFNQFLHNIKMLNNKSQTKQQAMDKARSIFGLNNTDLYNAFVSILFPQ